MKTLASKHVLLAAVIGLSFLLTGRPSADQAQAKPTVLSTSDDLFQIGKVWDIHLTFTADSWKALKPVPSRMFEASHTDGFLGPEGKRNGISALRGIDFKYVHASFDLYGRRFDDVGIRYKGNGTYRAGDDINKYSFKIDLNKFVKTNKFVGLKALNLHSN